MLKQPKEIIVLLGAGQMGLKIVQRLASNHTILLGDINEDNLARAKEGLLDAGFVVETKIVDGSQRESIQAFADYAQSLGEVTNYIHTAGVSPNMANPQPIIDVDLVGTAIALEIFRDVIAPGGAGLVISSQAGHMFPLDPELEQQLATVPADQLAALPGVKAIDNSGLAYGVAKRANIVRVQHEAVLWGDHGARLNTVSPGVIITPLARHELAAQPEAYGEMIETSPAGRPGTPDEVAAAAEFLLDPKNSFITGTDLLIDGGVIAAMATGRYQLHG